jgi:KDEL-tailed cysteine endopeptidase
MRKGFTALAVVGIAAVAAVLALTQNSYTTSLYGSALTAQDYEFIKYVAHHGKSYATKEEYEFRSALFKETLAKIEAENLKSENTFTVGINKFADWTKEEYRRLLGYKSMRAIAKNTAALPVNVSIPSSVDWRTEGAVNPVKDQGQCGSCWAFSAVSSTESRYKIAKGTLYSLSEQQVVDCCNYGGSEGCNGGDEDLALDYIGDKGIMTEKDYPYTAYDQSCAYDAAKLTPVKPTGHTLVQANIALALKTAIAAGPVSVAIEADTFVFQFYSGGILNSAQCGTELDHAVVAVGYGVDSTKGEFYIVRNSWGASWGDKGYVRIAGGKDGPGICGIQQDCAFPNF